MKFLAPAATAVVLGCSCLPAAHAQTVPPATDAGILSRTGAWFAMDWTTGWESGADWRLLASPYTYHFSRDPDHKHVYSLGLERQRRDGFTVGGSFFRNSFGQPSAYLYVGQRFEQVGGIPSLYAQLTGGLLYGYKAPYDHKVPLNYKGFSPGLVPSLGWRITPTWSTQLNFLGNSALMFQVSAELN